MANRQQGKRCDTPRTEAELARQWKLTGSPSPRADFARMLERELNAANEELASVASSSDAERIASLTDSCLNALVLVERFRNQRDQLWLAMGKLKAKPKSR